MTLLKGAAAAASIVPAILLSWTAGHVQSPPNTKGVQSEVSAAEIERTLRNVLEASLATFWAASSQLFGDSDITSMTLTIFAINLVPFPAYIAGGNGRGCYSVALSRLQDRAVLKRPGSGFFRLLGRQATVMHRTGLVIEDVEEFAASSRHPFDYCPCRSDDILAFGQRDLSQTGCTDELCFTGGFRSLNFQGPIWLRCRFGEKFLHQIQIHLCALFPPFKNRAQGYWRLQGVIDGSRLAPNPGDFRLR